MVKQSSFTSSDLFDYEIEEEEAILRKRMNEPRLKFFSGGLDINFVALWVGKERALKPFLQLFITADQKVCLTEFDTD